MGGQGSGHHGHSGRPGKVGGSYPKDYEWTLVIKGGPDSGNHGHAGRPGQVGGSAPSASYEQTGDQLGTLYHGGKRKITEVDPELLQSRDHGFYGAGFYMTGNREYAGTYGRTISKAKLPSSAKVLVSALTSEEADPRLVEDVRNFTLDLWERRAKERGRPFDRSRAAEELQYEIDSPPGWGHLVTSYGSHKKYDVIKHSNGEIVVRNYKLLEFFK